MVILAGTGSGPNNQKAAALWDQSAQLQVHFIGDIRSAGYDDAAAVEGRFSDAERIRLLYVACTRAESHLVVSHYVNAKNSLVQFLRDAAEASAAPDLRIPEDMPIQTKAPRDVRPVETLELWQQKRATWQKSSAIASSISVTAIAKGTENKLAGLETDGAARFVSLEEAGKIPSFAEPGGEHGTEFGTALHRLLELSDLRETENFDALARRIAGASGLEDPAGLAERARSALRSAPVQRAADREHWLELPVVTSVDGVTLEGIIDLMYREDNGTLVIVDFKTDIYVPQERLGSYWRQLSTYARMVERITGQTVSELVLILCRAGEAEVLRQSRQSKAGDDL
jgi:ATP-dependent helicase/nuclease subunit A